MIFWRQNVLKCFDCCTDFIILNLRVCWTWYFNFVTWMLLCLWKLVIEILHTPDLSFYHFFFVFTDGMDSKKKYHLPSRVLFLEINAKSISEFGSFCASDEDDIDDDDDEFSNWEFDWDKDGWFIVDGAIWWFWNGCIIDKADVICRWETCDIPLLKEDDTQIDICRLHFFN